MSAYPNYKDSGIQWIGAIPSHWRLERAKFHFSERNERGNATPTLLAATQKYGMYPQELVEGVVKVADGTDMQQFKTVHIGDFVISLRSFQGGFERSDYEGVCSPAYQVFSADNQWNTDYLKFLFKNELFVDSMNSLTVGIREGKNIKYSDFGNSILAIPPIEEQRIIADYLNKTVMHIDNIITEAKASIEEYNAWKTSIIYEVVTKGLDPNVETKDSGIEWIGNIPSTWKIVRGKNILVLLDRPVKSTDEVITCFRDGEVTLRKNRREDGFTISLQEAGYQGVEPGDLVVHGMDGFAGAIGVSDSRGKATPVLNVMDSSQNKRFLMYYLRAAAYKDVFMSLSTGIRVRSCDLRWNKIAIFPFIIPPIEKQNEIVNYIDSILPTITAMVEEKEKLISDLESYKKSLIFEVVTGKRRVC